MRAEKQRPRQRSKIPPKWKGILTTDREGGLPLPPEWGMKIGDKYAAWKEGADVIVVFTKNYRGKRKIPKHAHWGKVEPALPEKPATLPKPGTVDRQQALKDLMAIGPVRFKPRKPPKVQKPKAPRANRAAE